MWDGDFSGPKRDNAEPVAEDSVPVDDNTGTGAGIESFFLEFMNNYLYTLYRIPKDKLFKVRQTILRQMNEAFPEEMAICNDRLKAFIEKMDKERGDDKR